MMILASSQREKPSSSHRCSVASALPGKIQNFEDGSGKVSVQPKASSSSFRYQEPYKYSVYSQRPNFSRQGDYSPIPRPQPSVQSTAALNTQVSNSFRKEHPGVVVRKPTSWIKNKYEDSNQNGRISVLLEEMRPTQALRNCSSSPSQNLMKRRSLGANYVYSTTSNSSTSDSASSTISRPRLLPIAPDAPVSSVSGQLSPLFSPSSLDTRRLEPFETSAPRPVQQPTVNCTISNGYTSPPAVVKLALPDSWMLHPRAASPVSPSVPHTFSPHWRRAVPQSTGTASSVLKDSDYGCAVADCLDRSETLSDHTLVASNFETAAAAQEDVKVRATVSRDFSNKRYCGSDWEQHLDMHAKQMQENDDESGSSLVRLSGRQSSFKNAISRAETSAEVTAAPSHKAVSIHYEKSSKAHRAPDTGISRNSTQLSHITRVGVGTSPPTRKRASRSHTCLVEASRSSKHYFLGSSEVPPYYGEPHSDTEYSEVKSQNEEPTLPPHRSLFSKGFKRGSFLLGKSRSRKVAVEQLTMKECRQKGSIYALTSFPSYIPPLGSSTQSLAAPVVSHHPDETIEHSNKRPRPKSYLMATTSQTPLSASEASIADASKSPQPRRALSSFPLFGSSAHSGDTPPSYSRKHASGVPNIRTTHRIQRFITFFSSNDNQKQASGSSSAPAVATGKRYIKKSSAAALSGSSAARAFIPIYAKEVRKQGQLYHQETALGEPLKSVQRRWEQCWAVLQAYNLYLCPQLSSYISDETREKILNIPGDSKTIDLRSAIIDIAYELLHRKDDQRAHVLRVVTQRRTEHLLQADSEEEMLKWIDNMQQASTSNEPEKTENSLGSRKSSSLAEFSGGVNVEKDEKSGCRDLGERQQTSDDLGSSSLAARAASPCTNSCDGHDTNTFNSNDATTKLIMHRYKAKTTQLGSPVTTSKRGQVAELAAEHVEQPGTSSTASGSTAGSTNEGASTSTNQSVENIAASTPKPARKWKKSRTAKQMFGSTNKSEKGSVQSTSALGQKIADCPTSGEGDLVPLLVHLCVKVVEAHGMDTVGIYRIPGNTAAVNALKENLNLGFENINFQDQRWRDVNVVSSLLKMFLRKLPEPLLTDKLYPFFIDANRIAAHPQRLHKLRNLVRKLPAPHYATLKFLVGHLRLVVAHSSVNKMETRNLALMFGPSIVRPSDDNMATMVTHMSDQCRIIETFISYYDWIFNDAGSATDEVPSPVITASDLTNSTGPGKSGSGDVDASSQNSFTTTSLNDMHNLLRRVNEAEAIAMMDGQRGGKIKQILNVRRNSKKDKSRKRDQSAHSVPSYQRPTVSGSSESTSHVEQLPKTTYQERDIDAEIASRGQLAKTEFSAATTSLLGYSPSLGSSLGSITESSQHGASRSDLSARNEASYSDADAMRKKRQQEIYSARRIFISGTDADPMEDPSHHRLDLDDLVSHTRHLNLAASPALDVLSAETREKIRRMQQLQGWVTTANERREADVSKRSYRIAEPYYNDESTKSSRKGAEEFSSTDAISLTSDYSTTSSAPLTAPVTVSCVDHLATTSSDYASSDVSPCTRNISVSPRPQGSTSAELQMGPKMTVVSSFELNPSAHFSTDEECGDADRTVLPCDFSLNRTRRLSDAQGQVTQPLIVLNLKDDEKLAASNPGCSSRAQRVRARAKASRKDLWRRHTLSDVDIIRQAIAQEKAREKSAAAAPAPEKSKVSKLARWIKNSFRRSSHDLIANDSFDFHRASSFASQSPPSSGGPTPPSEIVPSSSDEQL